MLIESIWAHVLTPFFYMLMVIQLAAYATFGSTSLSVFVSTCVLGVAFAATQSGISRPFHLERGAAVLALILAYLGVLASQEYSTAMLLNALHVHDGLAATIALLAYNAIWLLVIAVTLIGFLQSPTRCSPMLWGFASIIAFALAVVPLEADLLTDPVWLIGLRFNIAFAIYVIVALSDAAYLAEYACFKTARRLHHGERSSRPNDIAVTADVPFIRTCSWISLTIWPLFAKAAFLPLPLGLTAILAYTLHMRWKFAQRAHQCVITREPFHMRNHWTRLGHIKDTLSAEAISKMDREQLLEVVTDLAGHPSHGHHAAHRKRRARASLTSAIQS